MANTSVYCLFHTYGEVDAAVDKLRAEGFRSTDISALFPHNEGSKDFAHVKHTKAPEGAAAGASTGAVVGGALGWLAGIGALAIPGAGPFIAAGPLMGLLAGAGAVGALGGIGGALVGLGMPEYEAVRYAGRISKGGILLSVHCDDHAWIKKAEDILRQAGADEIDSSTEASADFDQTDKPHQRSQVVLSK